MVEGISKEGAITLKKAILSSLLIVVVGFAIFAGPWLLLYVGLLLGEDPPKPTYTYGETIRVEDTIIVKYDGIGLSEGTGKYIKWKKWLASGNDDIILYKDDELTIKFPIMSGEYYITSDFETVEYNTIFPNAIREVKFGGGRTTGLMPLTEMLYKYKIKLLKLEHGEPLRR